MHKGCWGSSIKHEGRETVRQNVDKSRQGEGRFQGMWTSATYESTATIKHCHFGTAHLCHHTWCLSVVTDHRRHCLLQVVQSSDGEQPFPALVLNKFNVQTVDQHNMLILLCQTVNVIQ